jgi:hypothetical protein
MKVIFNPSLYTGTKKDDEVMELIKKSDDSPQKRAFLKEIEDNTI